MSSTMEQCCNFIRFEDGLDSALKLMLLGKNVSNVLE